MRNAILAASAAASLSLAACAGGGYGAGGYGGGYGGGGYGGGTALSQCTRNALLGAGVGAVAGALAGSEDNRGENAALGGAAAGLATYGVCRYLDNQQQARIESAYRNAASSYQPVGMNWVGTSGTQYVLDVNRPNPVPGQPNCVTIRASLAVNQQAPQPLPPETYCRQPNGTFAPVT